jgi:hypothetical protein
MIKHLLYLIVLLLSFPSFTTYLQAGVPSSSQPQVPAQEEDDEDDDGDDDVIILEEDVDDEYEP